MLGRGRRIGYEGSVVVGAVAVAALAAGIVL